MNPLDVHVSYFHKCTDVKNPDNRGTFLQVVTSKKLAAKHNSLIQKIRNEPDEDKRKELKIDDPCITVSGTFSEKANEALLKHSGLLAFDIDTKSNPALNASNAPSLRDKIALFPQVWYCSLSVSGTGVWGVVVIEKPELHLEHFLAMEADFAAWGLVIDKGCKDVSRLRFLSFDPDAKIKTEGTIYKKLLFPEVHVPKPRASGSLPNDLALQAAEYLIREKITVAYGYDDYFQIVTACKNAFGDDGESIAWEILENSPSFAVSNFRKQFSKKWRGAGNKITGGTLVHIAKGAGFQYIQDIDTTTTAPPHAGTTHTTTPATIERTTQQHNTTTHSTHTTIAHTQEAHTTGTPQAAPDTALPPGYTVERFTNKLTGQTWHDIVNEDGLPAILALDDDAYQAVMRYVEQNPLCLKLTTRFNAKDTEIKRMSESEVNFWSANAGKVSVRAIINQSN